MQFIHVLIILFVTLAIQRSVALDCDRYDSCQACVKNESCSWCSGTETCIPNSDISSQCLCVSLCSNCVVNATNQEKCTLNFAPCERHTGCHTCTQDGACTWSHPARKCVPGDEFSPCNKLPTCSGGASLHFSFQHGPSALCPRAQDCNLYASCSECTSDPVCGWNNELQSCTEGDAYGPCSSQSVSCSGSAEKKFAWQYGSKAVCPVLRRCEMYSSCTNCTADPACGWNNQKHMCVTGTKQGACRASDDTKCSGRASASFYWMYGNNSVCPRLNAACNQYMDCRTCTSDPACGFNLNKGCVSGDAYGACDATQDIPCPGGQNKSTYWKFGPASTCPANHQHCHQYSTCDMCMTDPLCGWTTTDEHFCTLGDAFGPCFDGIPLDSWYFGRCPTIQW